MSKSTTTNMPGYYREAKDWYAEKYESITCSRNRYRVMVLLLSGLLGASVLSTSFILPLKKYYYRMVEVNNQTGEVTVLKEMEADKFPVTWAMSRYFINQYIIDRESYSFEEIKRDYNVVIALSTTDVANAYMAQINDTNPKSPIKTLNTEFYREAKVISIDQLNGNTALARFQTTERSKQGVADGKTKDWQAVIKWEQARPSDSVYERDQNPLGFKVNYYRTSPVFSEN